MWLRQQIDEDERVILDRWDSDGRARVATMWTGSEPGYTTMASDQGDGVWVADGREVTDARHALVLFDPARVLAEVAAKRAILEECIDTIELNSGEVVNSESVWLAESIVKAMAQPYAGRPGWREEWAT
jgi:hypothetical protein